MKRHWAAIFALCAVPLSSGCNDIHLGAPFETSRVTVSSTDHAGVDTEGTVTGASAPDPAIQFEWSGFVAEEIRVERCLYDCENQNDTFCWDKSDDYIEHVILHPDDSIAHTTSCGWAIGACSSFYECGGDGGVDPSEMIEGTIRYGELPDRWFVEQEGEAVPLEEGGVYAVGIFGFDCGAGEACEEVYACRMFRMEGGVPRMLQGTGD